MTTNIPAPQFTSGGLVVPAEQDILAGAMADIDAAFGGGLNPSPATPQGQLAASMAAAIGHAYDALMNVVTQIDPAYASGRMQDGIARIYNIERIPAVSTVVQATVGGLQGVLIPAGSIAQAVDGNLYYASQDITIPASGSVVGQFECAVAGPIACPAGTLNVIYQAIPGWNTITNIADGIIGNDVETRSELEARRRASVSKNSRGVLSAILAEVLDVSGVLDALAVENVNSAAQTIGGVSLAPKSIYVAAVGGAAQDIGNAIWRKKPPGAGYNGNTQVTVVDNDPAYSPPYPSYAVLFQIPTQVPIVVLVTLSNNSNIPANVGALVDAAVISAFTGADGGSRTRIGGRVYASRYYAAVAALGDWSNVVSVKIGSIKSPTSAFTASFSGTVMTVTAMSTGQIAVGQTIARADNSVPPGTVVTSIQTGTGGVGTYGLSNAVTLGSAPTVGITPNLDFIDTNIDQVATTSAANISTALV